VAWICERPRHVPMTPSTILSIGLYEDKKDFAQSLSVTSVTRICLTNATTSTLTLKSRSTIGGFADIGKRASLRLVRRPRGDEPAVGCHP
jgi:hypothetical protein